MAAGGLNPAAEGPAEIVIRIRLEYAPAPQADSPEPERPLLYKVGEVAELLSVGEAKVWELIASGDLASVKVGTLRRVDRDALADYVASLKQRSAQLGDGQDHAA